MKIIIIIIGLLFNLSAIASHTSLGDVAHYAMEPATGIAKAASAISIIIGIGFVISGYEQFRRYREKDQTVKISNFILLFLFGVVLIALPLLAKYTESGALLK